MRLGRPKGKQSINTIIGSNMRTGASFQEPQKRMDQERRVHVADMLDHLYNKLDCDGQEAYGALEEE